MDVDPKTEKTSSIQAQTVPEGRLSKICNIWKAAAELAMSTDSSLRDQAHSALMGVMPNSSLQVILAVFCALGSVLMHIEHVHCLYGALKSALRKLTGNPTCTNR